MLNTNLVVQLARMLTGAGMGVNDFGDKLHNWYTAIVFMLFTAVLGLRQYVMKPISYATPPGSSHSNSAASANVSWGIQAIWCLHLLVTSWPLILSAGVGCRRSTRAPGRSMQVRHQMHSSKAFTRSLSPSTSAHLQSTTAGSVTLTTPTMMSRRRCISSFRAHTDASVSECAKISHLYFLIWLILVSTSGKW